MRNAFCLMAFILFLGCKNKKNDPSPEGTPEKASLVYPGQNEICTQGTLLSPTQSKINFRWISSKNTESYQLTLKNLLTGNITILKSDKPELEVPILRNTPFSWNIISKSSKTSITIESDTWKFYNSGPGSNSYAPFPADIISPALGQNIAAADGKITLKWMGNDADRDIINYDIYFGLSNSTTLYRSNLTDTTLENVPVISGNIYFWKVITRDAKGNISHSQEFQFKVT